MMKLSLLIITFSVLVSCASDKSMKQEFNETADQVDNGVRRVIQEVKETAGKAVKKIQND